jgi:phosphoesterase RecJ-like protein
MVWTVLSLEDRKACGYTGNDDADLINMVSAIDGHKVAMIFVEQEGGSVKLSWRAQEKGIDVSAIATQFGGGGHKAAAGATIPGSLADVQSVVLKATQEMLGL